MTRVSLVGTVHEEVGRANVEQLLAILERIRPEVIFLEMPSAAFNDYVVVGCRHNLESRTVRRYRENHPVVLEPVDVPTPEREFFENDEYLKRRIADASPYFRQLTKWDGRCVDAYGFAYLNSEYCSNLWTEVDKAMQAAVATLAEPRLIDLLESWTSTKVRRERAWLKSIEDYCSSNNPRTGVFLVGAAHRQSLIDKLREQQDAGAGAFEWDSSGFLEGPVEKGP